MSEPISDEMLDDPDWPCHPDHCARGELIAALLVERGKADHYAGKWSDAESRLVEADKVIAAARALQLFAWPTLPMDEPKSKMVELANTLFHALTAYDTATGAHKERVETT